MRNVDVDQSGRAQGAFDHPEWLYEAKFGGFRVAADTVRGRLISRNGNRMRQFKEVLDLLPKAMCR